MSGIEVASIIGITFVGVGLIATWVRNGRNQARYLGRLETQVENIQKSLADENTGLGSIKKSVEAQEKHCAGVTSGFEERLKNLEKRKE